VIFFVCLMLVLSRLGVDWIPTLVISALPLGAITIFVHFFVNGRPPSYALDLLALQMWRLRCSWYLQRLLDKPPQLWAISRAPRHPKGLRHRRGGVSDNQRSSVDAQCLNHHPR
jgi:hypothetical protein